MRCFPSVGRKNGQKIGLVIDHYNLSLRVSRWPHGLKTIFDTGLEPGGANIPLARARGVSFIWCVAMLGLRADAPHKRLSVNPALPDWLPEIEVQHLRVGPCSITLLFWREGDSSRWEVREITADKSVAKDDMIQVVSGSVIDL